MKNIFKDAKFGDVFVTTDGREMKFVMSDENRARLLEDDKVTGRQYLWTYNLDGTNLSGEVDILHKATPKPMTEEYLLDKGYLKFQHMDIIEYASPNSWIIIYHGFGATNRPSCNWHVHVDNNSFDSIGALYFEYVDEFETFLKLCGVDYGEK